MHNMENIINNNNIIIIININLSISLSIFFYFLMYQPIYFITFYIHSFFILTLTSIYSF